MHANWEGPSRCQWGDLGRSLRVGPQQAVSARGVWPASLHALRLTWQAEPRVSDLPCISDWRVLNAHRMMTRTATRALTDRAYPSDGGARGAHRIAGIVVANLRNSWVTFIQG